jgi:nucleotide-binding universal stress UspA family protein
MGYRNVIVATDGSETAEIAVREAAKMAKAFDARLVVVTAFASDPAAEARAKADAPEELQWMATDAATADERANRGRAIAKQEGVKKVSISSIKIKDDPAASIINAAESSGGDLIVVGSKGMTSASRFISGNVPNRITHHAPCDVLVVHTAP